MKKQRCILIVDDKDQGATIKNLKLQLKQDFDLDIISIRTAATEFKKDNSEELESEKLKQKIHNEITRKHIDIALTDYDLADDEVNGLTIVDMVHEIRPKVQFLIYSGNWNKVIENVIGQDYRIASIEKLTAGINKLIHSNITNCIDRIDYKDDLIKHLRRDNIDSMEQRLCMLLREHSNLTFRSCFPEFKGKTFGEIADIIDQRKDARSDEWIEAVLSQTIAYLAEINRDDE